MRLILLCVALATSSVFVSPRVLQAAVISRDWKTPGDGLLTYDDVNQREWLDLSQTILTTQFPGRSRDERFDYVIGQTSLGGIFGGFTAAKSHDVIALAQSAGIDTTTDDFATNSEPTLNLVEHIGFTSDPRVGDRLAVGILDELGGPSYPFHLGARFFSVAPTSAGLSIGIGQTEFRTVPAVMLYRAIPEPDALLLVLYGSCRPEFRRRRGYGRPRSGVSPICA